MSTKNPQPDGPQTDSPEEPDAEPEPDFDTDPRPRTPPKADSPPRGTTRNIGGACPRCEAAMITRLRAVYGSDTAAKVKLQGYCSDDDCGFMVESLSETFALVEKEV